MCMSSNTPKQEKPALAPPTAPEAQAITRVLPGDVAVDSALDTTQSRAKKARSQLTIPKAGVAGSSGLNIPL